MRPLWVLSANARLIAADAPGAARTSSAERSVVSNESLATAGNVSCRFVGMNGYPDGWAEKGTEAYWAKREADQAALRLQFIKDKGIPPKPPDPRERLRHR